MVIKNLIFLILTISGLWGFYHPKAQAISLTIEPQSQTVLLGDSVVVDVLISDLGNFTEPSLGTFDIDLTFDSNLLSFTNVTYSDFLDLGFLGSFQEFPTTRFSPTDLVEVSFEFPQDLIDNQPNDFALASLNFDTLAVGTSLFDLDNVILGDQQGSPIAVDTINNSLVSIIKPQKVPESSFTLSLLIFGISLFTRTLKG